MISQHFSQVSAIGRAILLAVAYADIFDYPLTALEIYRYLPEIPTTPEAIREALAWQKGLVKTGAFYTLPGRASIVSLRQQREKNADRLWGHAIRYSRLIASIPFIRMVAVTGSLAVKNSDDAADIDYLIVTAPGRLWLCRALVLAVGRLAKIEGLNLCPNYLITTGSLYFSHHNLYVARELTQMVPISGMDVYHAIRVQNQWAKEYLPNADGVPPVTKSLPLAGVNPKPSQILERVLRTPFGSWIERWEMERKIQQLTRQQGDSPESNFSIDFCKGHDRLHAANTDEAFMERIQRLNLERVL